MTTASRSAAASAERTGTEEAAALKSVSIIIPVKPGGRVRALEYLSHASYPPERFEVLVAYGAKPSAQRNLAAAQATGEILFFLDDDSRVSPDFLERAQRHFQDPQVAAVGGPSLTPATDSPLQRAIGAAFTSPFGGGGVRNRYRSIGTARATADHELILCNLAFRREIFLSSGGLDERLYPNEENELMERLVRRGTRLIHDPALAIERSQRRTYRAFVRQMYGYGRGRGEQTVLSGVVKPVACAPSLFLLYLVAAPFLGGIFLLPALCYLLGCVAASVAACGGSISLSWRLLFLFPTLHLCYGAGMLEGLLAPRFKKGVAAAPEIEVRTVKRFDQSATLLGER